MADDDAEELRQDLAALNFVERSVLQKGERIVWKGRPRPGGAAKLGSMECLFGVFFLGFSLFWTAMALTGGNFALFGLPFIAIGAWMVATPLRYARQARRTYYAITNQRVIIVTSGDAFATTAVLPHEIDDYERWDREDGSGDMRLRQTGKRGRNGSSLTSSFQDGLWGVADIRGAAHAVDVLRKGE
jgi:hypothetical protein